MPTPPEDSHFTTDQTPNSLERRDTKANESTSTHTATTAANLPVISGYEIVEEIAQSKTSIVYRAVDTTLGCEVAVKIATSREPGADTESRFVRAAQIVAQLQHPGVPPIFDLGTLPDGRPFLVMKLIKGLNLADILAERANPIADRIRFLSVFEQLCQAVAYAHNERVIHRDLKPQNAMIGAFGEVQVIGWSSAVRLGNKESGLSDPANGLTLGTPAYMPPEQARGEWNKMDCRSDVFALGGILIEILTGRPTFAGNSATEVIRKAATGDLSEAFARLDRCGEDANLIALVKRCLSPNPAHRPADAGELAALVSAYRGGIDERLRRSEAEQLTAVIAVEKGKRRQTQLALLLVVGLFIIWTSAIIWWQDKQATVRRILEREREADEKQVQQAAERERAAGQQRIRDTQRRQLLERELAARMKQRKQLETPIQDDHIAPPPREVNTPGP